MRPCLGLGSVTRVLHPLFNLFLTIFIDCEFLFQKKFCFCNLLLATELAFLVHATMSKFGLGDPRPSSIIQPFPG